MRLSALLFATFDYTFFCYNYIILRKQQFIITQLFNFLKSFKILMDITVIRIFNLSIK